MQAFFKFLNKLAKPSKVVAAVTKQFKDFTQSDLQVRGLYNVCLAILRSRTFGEIFRSADVNTYNTIQHN